LELAIVERGAPVGSVALAEIADGNAMVVTGSYRAAGAAATISVRLLAGWAFATLSLGRLAAFTELDITRHKLCWNAVGS
jgi:hypothetical protein